MSSVALAALAFASAGGAVALMGEDVYGHVRVRRRARQQVGLIAEEGERLGPRVRLDLNRRVRAVVLSRQREKRASQIADELAPALQLVVGNLRIGRDVLSSIVDVSHAVAEPLRSILNEIIAEARIGVPLEEAVRHAAQAEDERHLGTVASALSLQATHGGSLVEILQTVVETIEEEDRLEREIRSVTADGRLSSLVLLAMPPVVLLFVSVVSPGYAAPLITDPLGRFMSIIGVLLGLVGWRWLRSLSRPKVVA